MITIPYQFKPYRFSSVFRRFMFSCLTKMNLTYSRPVPGELINDFFKQLWPVAINNQFEECGGYLVPVNIGDIDVVFSPGVGPSSEFELYFAKSNIPSYMADASVEGPSISHPLFNFIKKFVGAFTAGDYININDWIEEKYPVGNNAVLQIDIEGGEYETLLAMTQEYLAKFKLIVIEIHALNILATEEGYALARIFMNHLLKNFDVVHFHTNNNTRMVNYRGLIFPHDIELTLLRKDLCVHDHKVAHLPHPLDVPGNKSKPDPVYFDGFDGGVIRRLEPGK
jgi:hypothetical protein